MSESNQSFMQLVYYKLSCQYIIYHSSNDPAMNPDDRDNNDEKNELKLPLLPDENEALSDTPSSNSDDEPKSLIGKISGWINLPLHVHTVEKVCKHSVM